MQSKNKPRPTAAEARRIEQIKGMDCVVCDVSGPCDAHEPEQGMWFIAIPLCKPCHTGPDGWHGTRLRWKLRKMNELKAINKTMELLEGMKA